MKNNFRMLKKAAQQGRRELATEAYPWGTLQGDRRLRTPLADFFSILPRKELIW
jgi:hypothetical protein